MGFAATVQDWWFDRRAARAYNALGRTTREALARDAGLPEDSLARIVARGSGAGKELPRLLQAVYVDPEDLQRSHPAVMRDMQATCSMCAVASECRRNLANGVSRLRFHEYCPNTETIAALEGRTWWRDSVRA